jgi:hypothetical protein
MKQLHTRYAEKMKPLGLERGREGSPARHQRVKQFYASIEKDVELKVDHELVPDPPRVMPTKESARKYKEKILKSVLKQLEEPIGTLRDQAQLTKDERAHRIEAERRSAERVAEVERAAQERVAQVERQATDRIGQMRRSAQSLIDENRELKSEKERLLEERKRLNEKVLDERRQKFEFSALARSFSDRLADIPMPKVMEKLGYYGEREGGAHLYREEQGRIAVKVEQQKAFDSEGKLVCRNSLDLVVYMKRYCGMKSFTSEHALAFLRDEFGERRAMGAYLVNREQAALGFFDRSREERIHSPLNPVHDHDPWRRPLGKAEDRDRAHRGGGSRDPRGGRGRDFGR